MGSNDCVTADLTPFRPSIDQPWNRRRIQHLFERTGFGLSPSEVTSYLSQNPLDVVDQILDDAIAAPMPTEPVWAFWSISDYSDIQAQAIEQIADWTTTCFTRLWDYGLRDKMALFWSSHFVTQLDVYRCPSYLYQYYSLLIEHALGNFKELTKAVGTTPAMLVYLNGVENTRFQPNENYARELFELFTLGLDNGYTQTDITEAARALTGFNDVEEGCGEIRFTPLTHDNGLKTIFGQTAAFTYESLHDLLFAERQNEISTHICTKLYRFFIGREDNETIISELASTFIRENFEIVPVLKQLFQSQFFFDEKQFGTLISSPIELLVSHTRRLNSKPNPTEFRLLSSVAGSLGQELFSPPNVAGWPGDQSWLDTSLITARWAILDSYIGILYQRDKEYLASIGRTATTHFNEVELVCRDIIHHFMPWGLPYASDYQEAVAVFKYEIPENYFTTGQWNINWDTMPEQVTLLLQHIAQLPEYQLN